MCWIVWTSPNKFFSLIIHQLPSSWHSKPPRLFFFCFVWYIYCFLFVSFCFFSSALFRFISLFELLLLLLLFYWWYVFFFFILLCSILQQQQRQQQCNIAFIAVLLLLGALINLIIQFGVRKRVHTIVFNEEKKMIWFNKMHLNNIVCWRRSCIVVYIYYYFFHLSLKCIAFDFHTQTSQSEFLFSI